MSRMLQAIGLVAGGRLLQDLIIYRKSSGRLFLAELIFSACHLQHTLCSNGRGFQVLIISKHVHILSPTSLVMGAIHLMYGCFKCRRIQEFQLQSTASWVVLDFAHEAVFRFLKFWVNLLDSLKLNSSCFWD